MGVTPKYPENDAFRRLQQWIAKMPFRQKTTMVTHN